MAAVPSHFFMDSKTALTAQRPPSGEPAFNNKLSEIHVGGAALLRSLDNRLAPHIINHLNNQRA